MANEAPLLPAWTTEAGVERAAKHLAEEIKFELTARARAIEVIMETQTPNMVAEAEAFLVHESEGW